MENLTETKTPAMKGVRIAIHAWKERRTGIEGMQEKKKIEGNEKRDEDKSISVWLQGVTLHETERARKMKKNLKAYKYERMTETKHMRITDTSVWNDMRDK